MNMNMSIELKQLQKLSPELQQSLKILGMTSLELEALINQELQENPLLDFTESPIKDPKEDLTLCHCEDSPWEDYFRFMDQMRRNHGQSPNVEEEKWRPETGTHLESSLRENLRIQLHVSPLLTCPKLIALAEDVINGIDDNGYLTKTDFTKNSPEDFEKVLRLIQSFEPAGVGARSLEECLCLQLKRLDGYPEVYFQVVENHLQELALNHFKPIAKATGLSCGKLAAFKAFISTLNPKPGQIYGGGEPTIHIIPDAILHFEDGVFTVDIEDVSAPQLKINTYYKSLLLNPSTDEKTKDYIKERLDSALYLIRNVGRRRDTLKRTIETIVEMQQDFFLNGAECLKPMTMRDMADTLGVHESTISRAIRGKYIQTPQTAIPLKYFFSRGYSCNTTKEVSANGIMHLIKEMVANEDKKHPYSDQKIVDYLEECGHQIARRTVSKYRTNLGILNASERRQR